MPWKTCCWSGLLALFLAVPAVPAAAQVETNSDIGGLGTFTETSTGLVWLRLDNFFEMSPNEMVFQAALAGFTVANRTQVGQLLSSLPLTGGQWSLYSSIMGSAPNRDLMWGMFDTGSTAEQGWAYAYQGQTSWSYQIAANDWDITQNSGTADSDLNLWAYRTATTVPEPGTWLLLGSGLLGLGFAAVRRRREELEA